MVPLAVRSVGAAGAPLPPLDELELEPPELDEELLELDELLEEELLPEDELDELDELEELDELLELDEELLPEEELDELELLPPSVLISVAYRFAPLYEPQPLASSKPV